MSKKKHTESTSYCKVCGKQFEAVRHQIYCSEDCRKKEMVRLNKIRRAQRIRKVNFAKLLKYVEVNNLRKILKKYLPKKAA